MAALSTPSRPRHEVRDIVRAASTTSTRSFQYRIYPSAGDGTPNFCDRPKSTGYNGRKTMRAMSAKLGERQVASAMRTATTSPTATRMVGAWVAAPSPSSAPAPIAPTTITSAAPRRSGA
jgi:hypothetical protein